MTTLPTRPDGGIDWESLSVTAWGVYWSDEDKMLARDSIAFASLVERHTIERCAKVAEGEKAALGPDNTRFEHGCAAGRLEAADAIRKLEM